MSDKINDYLEIIKEDFKDNINFQWEFDDLIDEYFKEWFIANCEIFERLDNEETVLETLEITQKTNNQCFHNSQLLCLKNGLKYYEGFVFSLKFKMSFHHGFNIFNNKAIDITDYYNNTFKSDKDSNWSKESVILYVGINIPNDFLEMHPIITEESNVHWPLIYKYYSFIN